MKAGTVPEETLVTIVKGIHQIDIPRTRTMKMKIKDPEGPVEMSMIK